MSEAFFSTQQAKNMRLIRGEICDGYLRSICDHVHVS